MPSHLATLIVRGLSVAAGPDPLLADIDLIVAPGDRLGLVGPNGSGKSTLLQTLAGLRLPEDGHVRLAPPSATVGYLPQEARPRPGETVRGLLARRTGVTDAGTRLDAATGALARGEPGALVTHDRRLLDAVGIDRVVDVVDGSVRERVS